MYSPKLYPGPTIQSRSRAAQDLVVVKVVVKVDVVAVVIVVDVVVVVVDVAAG